jgi:hypothetical protein
MATSKRGHATTATARQRQGQRPKTSPNTMSVGITPQPRSRRRPFAGSSSSGADRQDSAVAQITRIRRCRAIDAGCGRRGFRGRRGAVDRGDDLEPDRVGGASLRPPAIDVQLVGPGLQSDRDRCWARAVHGKELLFGGPHARDHAGGEVAGSLGGREAHGQPLTGSDSQALAVPGPSRASATSCARLRVLSGYPAIARRRQSKGPRSHNDDRPWGSRQRVRRCWRDCRHHRRERRGRRLRGGNLDASRRIGPCRSAHHGQHAQDRRRQHERWPPARSGRGRWIILSVRPCRRGRRGVIQVTHGGPDLFVSFHQAPSSRATAHR